MIDARLAFSRNLERVRKRLGKSHEELGKEVGLTRQAIYKYEKGEVNPSMGAVFRISEALKLNVDYFFQNRTEREEFRRWLEIIDVTLTDALSHASYRNKEGVHHDLEEKVKRETYTELVKLLAVEKITHDRIEFRNPIENLVVKSREDAENAALELRRKWQLHENAIANVMTLLESKGIRVVEILADQSFQGLSAKYGQIPIIVLNSKVREVTRRRFTALHELGHLLMNIPAGIDHASVEKICDSFAATMLLPRRLLRNELGERRTTISTFEILRLKGIYGISVQAISVSALLSKIINWDQYQKLTSEVNSRSLEYRIIERPTRFKQLLSRAEAELWIDTQMASDLRGGRISDAKSDNLITEAL